MFVVSCIIVAAGIFIVAGIFVVTRIIIVAPPGYRQIPRRPCGFGGSDRFTGSGFLIF